MCGERYTNADLKISLDVFVHIKTTSWKILGTMELFTRNACELLTKWLIFNILHFFWIFVSKYIIISRTHNSKIKKCYNMKPLTYHFYIKTKILTNFQICFSIPLKQHRGTAIRQNNSDFTFVFTFEKSLLINLFIWRRLTSYNQKKLFV